MSKAKNLFSYSIGKKLIMSITGLFLISFLIVHLSGNLLLLKQDGGVAFNAYSDFMSTNPLIRVTEIILVLGFLFHIVDGLWLAKLNKDARPVNYNVKPGNKTSSWFSRNMAVTGSIILIFLVVHLRGFLVEHRILGNPKTMYEIVQEAFEIPWYSGFYVLSMILLAFHLNHGFQSAFQSLGLNHKKYNGLISKTGTFISIIIPLGFAIIPIYFLVKSYLN
ncbi:MAG: succinate dehydrogenase [Chitinophagaceae bacterium]|nr:MAG: succinate dehydrogenase [Chitinophagaceae bacterium]